MSLAPGDRIGPYDVSANIGAGGMGEVYRARDTKLNRVVALKVLPDSFASDPERVARFRREAQTLAALNHPNIAQIYGFEESGKTAALAMEFVDGDDLAVRLQSGPLSIEDAVAITRQIAEALEAAHDRGIVHRDLKPANVKVAPDGAVKVLDFGLAKAISGDAGPVDGAAANSPTITTPAMTLRGVILGTASYMAPEQAKGRPVDRRADLWALGCVLYELLTGVKAFDGEDVTEILGAIVKTEPDWSKLPADTPPSLRALLRRCLQKNPRQRLDSAAVIRLELSDLGSAGAPNPSANPRESRRDALLAWTVVGLLALGLAGLGYVAVRPKPPSPIVQLSVVSEDNDVRATTSYAISPDGKWLTFEQSNHLVLRPIGSTKTRDLPGTEGPQYPFWSPDSRSIAFFADGHLRRIDISGGTPRNLAEAALGRGGAWNRDGVIVFAPTSSSALLKSAGKRRRCSTCHNARRRIDQPISRVPPRR